MTTFALQWLDPDTRCPATSFHDSEAAADAAAVVLVRGGVADETWIFEMPDLATFVEDEIAHATCPTPVALADPCLRCFMVPATNGACGCDA